MERRRVLLGAAGVGLAVSAPSVAKAGTVMRAASLWDEDAAGAGAAMGRVSRRLAAMSGGELTVEGAVWRGAPEAAYRAVADGEIDILFGEEEAWAALDPAYALFASAPGGMTGDEFEGWIFWGGGLDLWRELGAQVGVTPYLCGDRGASPVVSTRPMVDPADVAGAPVQAAGLSAAVWRGLGAVVVGPGDAAEAYCGADAWAAAAAGMRYAEGSSYLRPQNMCSANVSSRRLSELSEHEQSMLRLAFEAEHAEQRMDATLAAIVGAPELEGYDVGPQLSLARADAVEGALEAIYDSGALASDIVWSFRIHREDSASWTRIGEGAYVAARAREAAR